MPASPATRAAALVTAALLLGSPGAAALAAENPPGPAAEARPNVVLVLIDALRADHLGFYGYHEETAPFLASLAAKGVVFENAFATAPSTAPSTASLFTSLYPDQHGVLNGRFIVAQAGTRAPRKILLHELPEAMPTLGEVMKKAGYKTMAVADNKNVGEEMGFSRGFDLFSTGDPTAAGGERLNAVLREWHATLKQGEPYFLYVHYIDPHSPYHTRRPWYKGTARDFRGAAVERYDSEIGYVDGKIREMYELFGWDRNTLLIVLADHGEEFWEHGGTRHGRTLYGEVLRIPLLIVDATGRIRPGRVSASVSNVDVLPTIADFAGLPPDDRRSGVSLLAAAGGGSSRQRDLFAYVSTSLPPSARRDLRVLDEAQADEGSKTASGPPAADPQAYVARAILRGGYKLILDSEGAEMLFDLAADPHDAHDLAARMLEKAAELRRGLQEFLAKAPRYESKPAEETLSDEDIEKLRSLGYVQ